MASNSLVERAPDARLSQAQRTAVSDARMLEAAIRLIRERGVEKTTLREVGELAGYSRGLAGYRFGSKEGLFGFVVRSIGEEWIRDLLAGTRGKTGLDAIEAAVDAHLRFVARAPDHVRAFYILWFESIGPGSGIRDVIARVHERRYRDVQSWIRAGIEQGDIEPAVDAPLIAEQFAATIVGIVYQWLVGPESLDRIRAQHEGLKQTMRRLLPRPAPAAAEGVTA